MWSRISRRFQKCFGIEDKPRERQYEHHQPQLEKSIMMFHLFIFSADEVISLMETPWSGYLCSVTEKVINGLVINN